MKLAVAEDNEAVIKILKKGRSAKLRHIHRTHRVDTDWLYEIFSEPTNLMRYVNTKHQIADFNTKAITKADTWWHLMKLAQIMPPRGEPGDPGGLQATNNNKGKTGKRAAKTENTTTATVCVATMATRPSVCEDYQTNVPPETMAKSYTFCCPIPRKKRE